MTATSAMPSSFADAIGPKPSANGSASTSVHSGALEPELDTPGLKEKPWPSATLRANCR